jgi:hypothetical protein
MQEKVGFGVFNFHVSKINLMENLRFYEVEGFG